MLTALVALVSGSVIPQGLIGGAAALLIGSVVAGWWLLAKDGRAPGALGFHLSRETVAESLKGLAVGVSVGAVVVALMAASGGLRWTAEGGDPVGWLTGALGALAFLAIPAAAEEALLRGYPLQAMAEVWGARGAIVVTSTMFGLLHLSNPGASVLGTVNVVAAGALLGVVYVRTASLWWATGVHLGWNWTHGFLADVPVSGLEVLDAPLYEGVPMGPEWLSGGQFGPEGSLIATVVLLGASAVLWRAPWLRRGVAMTAARPLYEVTEAVG